MGFKSECTPEPDTTYDWGRSDCPTAPKQPEFFEFPKVEMKRDQMLDFFTRQFGLNATEVKRPNYRFGRHAFEKDMLSLHCLDNSIDGSSQLGQMQESQQWI